MQSKFSSFKILFIYITVFPHLSLFTVLGRSKKDPFPTHRGNFRGPGRGEGESSKECLKFI